MRNYENFACWKTAKDLGLDLHLATAEIDLAEKTELFIAIRSSIRSVMTSIACGSVQKNADFANYLSQAIGDVFACRTQLELAHRLEWLDESVFYELDQRLRSLGFQIHGLKKRVSEETRMARDL